MPFATEWKRGVCCNCLQVLIIKLMKKTLQQTIGRRIRPLPRAEKCVKIQATCSAKMISLFTAFFQLSVNEMNRNEVLIPVFRFTTKAGLQRN